MKRLLWIYFPLLLAGCRLEDPLKGVGTNEVIALSAERQQLIADGRDGVLVRASLLEQAAPNLSITFRTEAGSFSAAAGQLSMDGRSVTLIASGRSAEALLIADRRANPRVGISAEVGGFVAAGALAFERAYPDEVILRAANPRANAQPGAAIPVSLTLLRQSGQVSLDTRVHFSVEALPGNAVRAEVNPFVILPQGIGEVSVRSLDSLAGALRLIASVPGPDGQPLASASIELTFD